MNKPLSLQSCTLPTAFSNLVGVTLKGAKPASILLCQTFLMARVKITYQENVSAEFEDAVDAWQLLKHDGVTNPTEELSDKLPNH